MTAKHHLVIYPLDGGEKLKDAIEKTGQQLERSGLGVGWK